MKEISIQELFDYYQDTLEKCGMYLLAEDEEVIGYNIYEEFDIGIHTFFHRESLDKLFKNGFISENKVFKSEAFRKKVIELQDSEEWGIENFRTSDKWRGILQLADELKTMR